MDYVVFDLHGNSHFCGPWDEMIEELAWIRDDSGPAGGLVDLFVCPAGKMGLVVLASVLLASSSPSPT